MIMMTVIITITTKMMTVTMMMSVIQQTWKWGTELFATSLLPPLLQILQFIHVRGEISVVAVLV